MDSPDRPSTAEGADGRAFRHAPARLAVTGGIGSGKSTALAFLAELGAATLSSDDIIHEVYRSPAMVRALDGRFGAPVVLDGQVNRAALSHAVFADHEALVWLERLTHPLVRRRIEAWAWAHEASPDRPALLAVEVPLLFESGQMLDLFDCVLLVTAPAGERRRRLSAKMTADDFDRRAAHQMGEAEKAERSHFVFENTGSRTALRDYLAEVVSSVLARAEDAAQDGVEGALAAGTRAGGAAHGNERDDLADSPWDPGRTVTR